MANNEAFGAMVFSKDRILLLQNDKHEWSLPVYISPNSSAYDNSQISFYPENFVLSSLEKEFKANFRILQFVDCSIYDKFSIKQRRPVQYKISWYLFELKDDDGRIIVKDELKAKFFTVEEGLDLLVSSKDKSALTKAYQILLHKLYG